MAKLAQSGNHEKRNLSQPECYAILEFLRQVASAYIQDVELGSTYAQDDTLTIS